MPRPLLLQSLLPTPINTQPLFTSLRSSDIVRCCLIDLRTYAPSSSSPTRIVPSLPRPSAQKPPTEGVLEAISFGINVTTSAECLRLRHAIVGEEKPEPKDRLGEDVEDSIGDDLRVHIDGSGSISKAPDSGRS